MQKTQNDHARWVLVADASRAILFRGGSSELTLKQEFDNPGGRAKASELTSGAQGEMTAGGGAPGRGPGAAPTTEPKQVEAERFARELADHLKVHVVHDPTVPLVLIAAPHFLGLLRASIDAQVAKSVELSIDKNFTNFTMHEMKSRVQEELGNAS